MTIWAYLNTDGSADMIRGLHDDMGGAALSLAAWPQGMTLLTAAQITAATAPTLAQAQVTQSALIVTDYYAASGAPIAYMGTTFQAGPPSQSLIAAVITASNGTLPTGFAWYDINNAPVAMTFVQLQGLAGEILLRGQPLYAHMQTQKAAIMAATTVTQVLAIAW